jgi:type II secretory pathway component GspD/PulD (secretin)
MRKSLLGLIAILFIFFSAMGWVAAENQKSDEPLAKVSFYKADLVAVLQQLAGECGYNVIFAPEIQGTVTLEFRDVTFEEVLNFIMKSHGLVYQKEGRNIFIENKGPAAPKPSPSEERKQIGFFHILYAEPQKIADLLKKFAPTAEVVADERTRTVVVQAPQGLFDQLSAIIKSLDLRMQQITIDVKVVEVSVSALRQLGADWQINDVSLTSSGGEMIIEMIKGGYTWSFIFDALTKNGNARLVTAPSISTVDGKTASILIGDKIPVINRDKDDNETVEYLDVGVKLNFTPWVQYNDDIRIDMTTQVNSLGDKNGDYYTISAREVSSKLQARIGDTLFLGGLITSEERNTLIQTPGLSKIPLLGKLFQRSEKSKDESELIVTITPRWTHTVQIKNSDNQNLPEVNQAPNEEKTR